MFSALFSFLGGSVFRMVWGEVSDFIKKRQEHKNEMEALRLQAEFDASRHNRDIERLRLQSELGIKEVEVKGDLEIQKTEAEAFVEAMKNAFKPTGIVWVDAWNGSIRPAAGTIALCLWVMELVVAGFVMSEWDTDLVGVILGFYFADRSLSHRGK